MRRIAHAERGGGGRRKRKTAIIESAGVIGLAQLPPGKFHPFALDTFGLGKVIFAARTKGAKRCLIGIGGSATNDGGFGVARALGWRFLDGAGGEITAWTELYALAEIRAPREETVVRGNDRGGGCAEPLAGSARLHADLWAAKRPNARGFSGGRTEFASAGDGGRETIASRLRRGTGRGRGGRAGVWFADVLPERSCDRDLNCLRGTRSWSSGYGRRTWSLRAKGRSMNPR